MNKQTIYSLTDAQRETMRDLIASGLVVSIGRHAQVVQSNRDLIAALSAICDSGRLPTVESMDRGRAVLAKARQ